MFRKSMIGVFLAPGILLAAVAVQAKLQNTTRDKTAKPVHFVKEGKRMQLSSSAFKEGEFIPQRYTCDGRNISPPLQWSGVPDGAKSLVLVCDDPDAPMGTWVHWMVVNIPAETTGLEEAEPVPGAAYELKNSSGHTHYDGPCPPGGVHRYFFKLYALDVAVLDNATPQSLPALLKKHGVAEAQLMGRYQRHR